MKKVRINELAREIEVKAHLILETLPLLGVTEKKTHSSSVDEDVAEKLRRYFAGQEIEETTEAPKDRSHEGSGALTETSIAEQQVAGAARPGSGAEAASDALAERETGGTVPPPKVEKFTAPATFAGGAGETVVPTSLPAGIPIRPPIGKQPIRPPVGATRVAPKPPESAAPAAGTALHPAIQTAAAPSAPAVTPPPPTAGVPGQPVQARTGGIPARPAPPSTPRPGQILTGPRQPLPAELGDRPVKPVVVPGAPRHAAPHAQQPAESPAAQAAPPAMTQQLPATSEGGAAGGTLAPPRPGTRVGARPLAGQPVARPVVPPRPDLVAKLMQSKVAPGQPARPGTSARPAAPVPGQPIYRGPIRPGQPIVGRAGPGVPVPGPGGPGLRRQRQMHPTSLRVEPVAPAPTDQPRRVLDKRRPVVVREEEYEEKDLRRPTSRRGEDAAKLAAGKEVTISEGITVKELSEKLGLKANLVIKKLVERKIFATINQTLDAKTADELAQAFGAVTTKMTFEEEAVQEVEQAEDVKDQVKRPPVVTIMGHVDHGKTSLLDAIRLSNVAEREAGGITQHIGAYHVEKDGRTVVFIDTPGHEAFTRMRARGAKVTDIVILVVAADDGVMPQTLEAIDHARAAEVPIIVAINKIDKPGAQPERVKQQLADRGLLAEDWGGDTVMVPVSAKVKQNLDLLLEMILLVADMQDLKANPGRPALGTVLEAQLDKGRGPVATVLMQNGTLHVGDYYICGSVFGRVRAMYDDRGQQVREVGPSMPVEVLGLESLPEVGDTLQVVTDTAKAKQIVIYREAKAREQAISKTSRLTLEQLHEQIRSGETKELPIIIKADVGGSTEVLIETLQKLSNDKVKIRVIGSGVGAITESDVLLASTSNAVIIGFNVRPDRNAAALAEQEKVDIRLHTIIYELTDEVKKAMSGMLEPVFKEVYKGRAEVRETFRVTKVGMVAGCYVQDGVIARDSDVRLLRDNVVIHTGRVASLRRFKDDVSEVKNGMECGIVLANFGDVKPGDVIEAFATVRVASEILV